MTKAEINRQAKELILLEAQIEFEKIEKEKSSWKSKVWREMEIWEAIVFGIMQSSDKHKRKVGRVVMDLFAAKYRND